MRRLLLALPFALLADAAASPYDGDGARVERFDVAKPRPFVGTGAPLVRERAGKRTTGALAGKTIYVSAGHGWLSTSGAWRTQRGNTHDLVEDFITAESVNQHLIAYLHAMGAYVVPIRESDHNPNQVVVDDGEAALEGDVVELPSSDVGWGAFETPFEDLALQPFALGTARRIEAAATETGRAVLAADVPEAGYYNVYISYVQGPDRVSDAHFIVRHSGGESHVHVDQRRHGSTWMLLGRWYFEAGGTAAVAVANDSGEPGGVISFDAVRFGGGVGVHAIGGATTGRPAYESAAQSNTQLLGAPRSVYDSGGADVSARPRFAAWEHEDGEDAIFLAWHTNAPSPQRGTLSIAYGNTFPCCSGLDDFAGTAGSLELLHAVHDRLIEDLRAGYDPEWQNRGKVTASLGELNPSSNAEMPAILVEVAFHDTEADAAALREPAFRAIAARGIARGVAKFFADKDGRALVLPPEPPAGLRVESVAPGTLRVSWRPADGATAYRVFVGTNGYGFDDGVEVTGESLELEVPAGALRFVRVAAVNDGGESLPTEVVGARVAASGQAPVLVVGGFDRLEAAQAVRDEAPIVGTLDRIWIDRMNNGTAAVRHALALAEGGFAFDGATDEALDDLDLAVYRALDWVAGEDTRLLPREALSRFALAGGKLLVTGSELVWALDSQGAPEDQQFVRETLHASLAADDAGTYDVMALDGPFAALPPMSFLDQADNGYDADVPDALAAQLDAAPVLAYATGEPAAIAWDGGIVLGFPLEVVQGAEARRALVAAAMAHFGIEPEPELPPPGEEAGGCCSSSGDASGALLVLLVVASRRCRIASRRRSTR